MSPSLLIVSFLFAVPTTLWIVRRLLESHVHEDLLSSGIQRLLDTEQTFQSIAVYLWNAPLELIPPLPGIEGNDAVPQIQRVTPIATSGTTSVFSLDACPSKYFLIYRQRCSDTESTLRDFFFLEHLAGSGISPRPYAVSKRISSVDMAKVGRGKLQEILKCRDTSIVPTVQYIIMERLLGITLRDAVTDHPRGALPIRDAVMIGIEIIRTIKKLHDRGIIHGDFHPGNVIRTDSGEIKLIDFERAKFFDILGKQDTPSCDTKTTIRIYDWFSIWESRLCVYTFRDDIVRVMFMMAMMIYGVPWIDYFGYLVKHGLQDEWVRLRSSELFEFDNTGRGDLDGSLRRRFVLDDVLPELDHRSLADIRASFSTLSHIALSPGIFDIPEYERMIDILDAIHAISS